MIPTAFGHYTVIRSLGSGGMADVYLANDPTLERQVAVKAPHPDFFTTEGRARFAREARAAAGLEHFAIVPIYDYNDKGDLPYMVMRYLTGGSLEDRIKRHSYAPAEALPIIERIAAALDYAHGRGVIHRDVKSANILFDDKDNAYLSDFGIAWMATAGETNRLTATGTVRGTFDYISPEQAQGIRDLDGRADLYSLAVVLFEMLTGDVPYRADSGLLVAAQHISAPIPDVRGRRPDLPPALSAVLARALAKRREDRYPTGAALVADLRRALSGQRVATPRPATRRPTPTGQPVTGRRNLWLAVAGVAVLGIVLFVLLRDTGGGGTPTPTASVTTPTDESDPPTAAPEVTSTAATVTEGPPTVAPEVTIEIPVANPSLPNEIVFQSNRDGDYEIYIMNADGSDQRQLTFNTAADRYPRVSPDGRRIVFQSRANDNTDIYVMNRNGSGLTRLTTAESLDELPSWSPDGREIIFNSWLGANSDSSDLFVIDAAGGEPQRLTDTAINEAHADWSSTGRLVFNGTTPGEDYFQIYTSNSDMSDGQKITASLIDEYSPQWSPDGAKILFISERGDSTNPGLFIMNANGSDARLLYNGLTEEWGASWSADGAQIIFTIDQPDGTADIYIIDADGGEPSLLAERGGYPSWAVGQPGAALPAGGGEITVSGTAARTPTGLMLSAGQPVVIEVTGGGWRAGAGSAWPAVGGGGDPQVVSKPVFPVPDRPIMTLVGGIGDGEPFPVGERLVYTAGADGELWLGPNDDNPADNAGSLTVRVTLSDGTGGNRSGDIKIAAEPIPLSGEGLVQLTFGERDHYTPVFAPDQSRILLSVEMGEDWQVFEADPNGGGLGRQLTSGPYDHYQADYSDDGQTFLTSANRDGDGDIYLFDAATGEVLQQLTNDHALDYHPRWLPDGESFIYSADDDGTGGDEIFLMTLDGRRTQLTDNDAFDGFATPSADGQTIAFYSGRDGDFEVYLMDIDGGNPRRLTTSPGRDASPSFSPDGRWVVFESERSGNYELYAAPIEGGEAVRLTDSAGGNWFPTISPDGRWLMFQSTRGGDMDIYRQRWDE